MNYQVVKNSALEERAAGRLNLNLLFNLITVKMNIRNLRSRQLYNYK